MINEIRSSDFHQTLPGLLVFVYVLGGVCVSVMWCARHFGLCWLSRISDPRVFKRRLALASFDLCRVTVLMSLCTACSVLHRPAEHLRPCHHVLLLRSGCHRPSHAEVSVVEKIPHLPAAGEHFLSAQRARACVRVCES